jgi:hypothetical protein
LGFQEPPSPAISGMRRKIETPTGLIIRQAWPHTEAVGLWNDFTRLPNL